MNKERQEMDIKTIIISHVKIKERPPVGPQDLIFTPAIYYFNEKQFDEIALELVDYINRNNRYGKNQTD